MVLLVSPNKTYDTRRKCLVEVGSSDEMNLHIPQTDMALAELKTLMSVKNHVVSGQKNSPVCGIVQDGLVAAYILTNTWDDGEHTLVKRSIFMDCVSSVGDNGYKRYETLASRASKLYPKYIVRPKGGKSRFRMKALPGKLLVSILFPEDFFYEKGDVKIERGVILPTSGPLTKDDIGAKGNSIVHVLWKEYSKQASVDFLSECHFLTDRWFPCHGFSIGLEDCFVTDREKIDQVVLQMDIDVQQIIESVDNPEKCERDICGKVNGVMGVGSRIVNEHMYHGDKNGFNIARLSGAKGSVLNGTQILILVGQQNIGGARIEPTISNGTRTLPHFLPNENCLEARGFVRHGYLEGLSGSENWHHAGAGRTGVIDTALKSVTYETLITICENEECKVVQIGEWIDDLLKSDGDRVENHTQKHMELLNLKEDHSVYIPSVDEDGEMGWRRLTAVTRHDPDDVLYRITTWGGRTVTVTKSKSLLVWNAEMKKFKQTNGDQVKVGDFMPTTAHLGSINKESCYLNTDLDVNDVAHAMDHIAFDIFDLIVEKYGVVTQDGSVLFNSMDETKILSINSLASRCGAFGKLSTSESGYSLSLYPRKNYRTQKDVVLDPIVSIDEVDGTLHKHVYDVTVPSTTNFCLTNGLNVVDTADSGYMQKKLARKMDGLMADLDGSVRSSGRIIQYLYGDEGMNPQNLYMCKGTPYPIFLNFKSLARRMMSKTKKPGRELTADEIDLLCSFIHVGSEGYQTPVTRNATRIMHSIIRDNVRGIKLADDIIPDFCREVFKAFETSKIVKGDTVGLDASTAIGEPTTQMSVVRDEHIIVLDDGVAMDVKIGDFIDSVLDRNEVIDLGNDSCIAHPQETILLQTISPTSLKSEWSKITEVSRHPCNGKLVKITTNTGRSVTTTMSHSHLRLTKDGLIAPIRGDALVVGDRIPVIRRTNVVDIFNTFSFDGVEYSLDEELGRAFGDYLSKERSYTYRITDFLEEFCGSKNKKVPAFAYFATEEFARGMLSAYFANKGSANVLHGETKDLLEGIALLLARFDIFGSFISETEYCILHKDIGKLRSKIYSDFGMEEIVTETQNDLDMVPRMRSRICDIAHDINLPNHVDSECIEMSTLQKYLSSFAETSLAEDLEVLKRVAQCDALWDSIVSIEILDDSEDFVYDFGVEGVHTFSLKSGIYVHNTLNTFHNVGSTGKDVTLGVPRLNELLNVTKNPSTPGCIIYSSSETLQNRCETLREITDEKIVSETRAEVIAELEEDGNIIAEIFVDNIVESYELFYTGDDVPEISPVDHVKYSKYEKKWWTKLHESMKEMPLQPENWVVVVKCNKQALYNRKISLREIAEAIYNESNGKLYCVPSPNVVGELHVYIDFGEIGEYIANKIQSTGEKNLISKHNVDYFTARDVAITFIKKIRIRGIPGIQETYPRELLDTKEWVLDTKGANFAEIIALPHIDGIRTLCDDVNQVFQVLGIEAARTHLISEFTKTISFDGTYINARHIELLVDRMIDTGVLTSVRRDGISREEGPIAKALFEKTVENFGTAAIYSESDNLDGVLAGVITGIIPNVGTGTCRVINSEKRPFKTNNKERPDFSITPQKKKTKTSRIL